MDVQELCQVRLSLGRKLRVALALQVEGVVPGLAVVKRKL